MNETVSPGIAPLSYKGGTSVLRVVQIHFKIYCQEKGGLRVNWRLVVNNRSRGLSYSPNADHRQQHHSRAK